MDRMERMTETPDPRFADLLGREYARLSQLKVGDIIETDGRFECLAGPAYDHNFDPGPYSVCRRCGEAKHGPAGSARPIRSSLAKVIECGDGTLGFACREGSHSLAEQIDGRDGDHLVGIYPVDMTPRGSAP